jgi:hypothetical protein
MRAWRHILASLLLVLAASAEQYWSPAAGSLRLRSMGGCLAASSTWWDGPLGNPAALRRPVRRMALELTLDGVAPFFINPDVSPGDRPYARLLPEISGLGRVALATKTISLALGLSSHQARDASSLPPVWKTARPASSDLLPWLQFGAALDHKVSLGVTVLGVYNEESQRREAAFTYGVLIRANQRMDVGAVAHYLPGAGEPFRQLDRLGDRTINVGMVIYPLKRPDRESVSHELFDPRIAIDVRNVTQEPGLSSKQELHLGSSLGIAGGGELRAGIFWPVQEANLSGKPRASLGLALVQPGVQEQVSTGSQGPWLLEIGWMQHPVNIGDGIWMLRANWVIRP